MKTSKVIKNLREMVKVYGDLDFSISVAIDKEMIEHITPDHNIVTVVQPLFFGYDQREQADGGSEIDVRNFPY